MDIKENSGSVVIKIKHKTIKGILALFFYVPFMFFQMVAYVWPGLVELSDVTFSNFSISDPGLFWVPLIGLSLIAGFSTIVIYGFCSGKFTEQKAGSTQSIGWVLTGQLKQSVFFSGIVSFVPVFLINPTSSELFPIGLVYIWALFGFFVVFVLPVTSQSELITVTKVRKRTIGEIV
jgi:hypothetical protein